jgi:hypothetical protein
MSLTRRSFLQRLAVAAAALTIKVPAFDPKREPYVKVGDVVNWIGKCPDSISFIGGKSVVAVGEWDGVGYPVTVRGHGYGSGAELETYCDVDLSNMNRDVPPRFWHSLENQAKYPNVHTYIRVRRYGERIDEAIRNLGFAGIDSSEWV